MDNKLTTIEIDPTENHHYSVIWLHGLGADGHDFESIVPSLQVDVLAKTRFVFPNAPIQAVTINNGMSMRAWYDILSLTPDNHIVDYKGIYRSAEAIVPLIQREIDAGIPPRHILLAGFSQGGVIALQAGLHYPETLAGILALSTYLPTVDTLSESGSAAGKSTPIFMAHGILDSVVAVESGKQVYEKLTESGYKVEWHDYLMEHAVSLEEIAHISAFMNTAFN
jgi:phospholipase/carboxylesterase